MNEGAVKFGLWLPKPTSRDSFEVILAFVRAADGRGFSSVWVGEHAVCFDRTDSPYPYASDERWPFSPEELWLEPFAYLSFLAAATARIRLGTGVVLLPQRNPVYTAKSAATLDFLSGGRLDLGLGVGWSREEFDALGVPFEGRGARCREYVEVMRALWCEEVASHEGPHYSLPPSRQRPRPVQQPHPPLWFGGESDPALRRVADLGQGWFGWLDPDGAAARIADLGRLLAERGRGREEVEVAIGCPWPREDGPAGLELVDAYAAAGVDQLLLAWEETADADAAIEDLDRLVALLGDRRQAEAVA